MVKNENDLLDPHSEALCPPPSCPWTQKIPIFIFEYFPYSLFTHDRQAWKTPQECPVHNHGQRSWCWGGQSQCVWLWSFDIFDRCLEQSCYYILQCFLSEIQHFKIKISQNGYFQLSTLMPVCRHFWRWIDFFIHLSWSIMSVAVGTSNFWTSG